MRIPFKRLFLSGSVVVVLFAAWFVYQLAAPSKPITVAKNTTVITEPLANDGLPDYAAHLLDEMSEGVTPENNGAIPLLKAMWPADLSPSERQAICADLGFGVPEADGIVSPYSDQQLHDDVVEWVETTRSNGDPDRHEGELNETELNVWIQDELLYHCRATPWQEADAPPVAKWVERNKTSLDLLREAARREKFYLPPPALLTHPQTSLNAMLLPQVQTLRSAERYLELRVNHHLGAGNDAEAWHDCRTMYGLSEACSRQALVGELVSIACESMAHRVTLNLIESDKLTPDVAEDVALFLRRREPRNNMASTIDHFERLGFVTAILEMSGQRTPADPSMTNAAGPLKILAGLSADWDLILETGNDYYDRLVEAARLPDRKQRQVAIDTIHAELTRKAKPTAGTAVGGIFSRTKRSEAIANVLGSLLLPAIDAAVDAEDRANTQLQLMQVAAALAVHRLENGEYPGSLGALVPDLLDEKPVDVYGNTLTYQKTEAGYLLYSTGANGQDDGGSNGSRRRYKGYDVPSNDEEENTALAELLGEPAELDEPGREGEVRWLEDQIPADADDHSLRLPLPNMPVPKFEPSEGAAG